MKPFLRAFIGVVVGVILTLAGIFFYGKVTNPRITKTADLPNESAAVITHIAGPVFVIRGDETLNASPGDRLQAGDVLKVTQGAIAQVQLADKGNALLSSDSLVRFKRLTGVDQQIDVKTEILTGSLSYTVKKLVGNESIVIEVDQTTYEVRGTEFLIAKNFENTLLVVSQGVVRVNGNVKGGVTDVGADQQLVVYPDSDLAIPEDISEENRTRLNASLPMTAMPFGYPQAPKPVKIEIVTTPPDAEIYVDGLKTGVGHFNSILPLGTVINILVRRRGFSDHNTDITANSDQSIQINLNPTHIDETLKEEEEKNQPLIRLKADYERRLTELWDRISGEAEDTAEREKREAETIAALEMELSRKSILQTELENSRAENEKLQNLIRQIQEITE